MLRIRSSKGNLIKTAAALLFLCISVPRSAIIISEIHYHPLPGADTADKNLYEFIEIKNTGSTSRGMGRFSFTDGITYNFPADYRLPAGEFVVLAADSGRFEERYGFFPLGIYSGKLNNSGERVTLVDTFSNEVVLDFEYDTKAPWPVSADGAGFSLVSVDPNGKGSPQNAGYWRASSSVHGSPGRDDSEPAELPVVYVNEILSHTDLPSYDAIEIFNPGDTRADISGWYLTDDKQEPKKYLIPDGSVIAPKGYLVFDERDFNRVGDANAFALSSHGEGAYIFSAEGEELTGYSHGLKFGEIDNGTSFGRYITSTGEEHCVAMAQQTLGQENSLPRVGPVVVTEINYNPSTAVSYVEIKNISAQKVDLFDPFRPVNTWQVKGLSFHFPPDVSLAAGEVALLFSDQVDAYTFRAINGLSEETKVFPFSGTLQSGGEAITIRMPCEPYLDDASPDSIIPYMDIDKVKYSNDSPWPTCEVGTTIYRKNISQYGNDPVNWEAFSATPGTPVLQKQMAQGFKGVKVLPVKRDMLRLFFTLGSPGPVHFSMTDLKGVQVKRAKRVFSAGGNMLDINTGNLASGIYVISVRADGIQKEHVTVIKR
ncbi:MAG: lamin tail domain-containing protein [Chitinispirillaceae bacterium]